MAEVKKNESLSKRTTFKIGGLAELYIIPENAGDLVKSLDRYPEAYIIGGGSNLLISDEGIPEVISLKQLKSFVIKDAGGDCLSLKVGAGFSLTALARKAKELSLAGLEFAYGIPGSVAGAVVMNAGAYGGEMKDVLSEVELLIDGKITSVKAETLNLSYRNSSLPRNSVIVSATFKLEKGDENEIANTMMQIREKRKETQPLEKASAGSIFKNPENANAGRIIDELGFKGTSIGDALVSGKHANFIINRGKATALQVLELIEKIENAVMQKKGIALNREIRLAGRF